MTDFVVITLKPLADIQAAAAALPSTDPLSRLATVGKTYLQDLGLRETGYASNIRTSQQAVFIQPWDGVSPVRNAQDFINGLLNLRDENVGKIRFLLTDRVSVSIKSGVISKLVAAGFMEVDYEKAGTPVHDEQAVAKTVTGAFSFALKVPPLNKTNTFQLQVVPDGGSAEEYSVISGIIDEAGNLAASGLVHQTGTVTDRDFISSSAVALLETGVADVTGQLTYDAALGTVIFTITANDLSGLTGHNFIFDAIEQFESVLIP